MTEFLYISKAAKYTRSSESTIKRHLSQLKNNPEQREKFLRREEKGKRRWMISTEYLDAEFDQPASATQQGEGGALELLKASNETLAKQLDVKDEQMAAKDEHIAELTKRLGEQNVLLQGLQNKLPELGSSTTESETGSDDVIDVAEKVKRRWFPRPPKMFNRKQPASQAKAA